MTALILAFTAAWASTAALSHTADTLSLREVVVRLPTGRSAIGVAPQTEAWVVPLDLQIGGTRVGVERQLIDDDAFQLSVSPSIAERWTARRTSLRLDGAASLSLDPSWALNAALGADVRVHRTLELAQEKTSSWAVTELRLPLRLAVDRRMGKHTLRALATIPVRDRGESFHYTTVAASWLRQGQRLGFEIGAASLLGSPTEEIFLGDYQEIIWVAYPKVDIWLSL